MTQSQRVVLGGALSGLIGLGVSSADPLGIALAVAMPALALREPTRRSSYFAAVCYYAAALWPLIPGAGNFFGPEVSALSSVALWGVAAALLASPWPLLWIRYRSGAQFLWRAPAALLITVLPPLGIIGWASPLTASGFLFPGTAWCGLAGCALVSGALAAWPRSTTVTTAVIALCANVIRPADPRPLPNWQGVDTKFGAIAHAPITPIAEYQAAEQIRQAAVSSSAKVIVFPESVVPVWTAATDTFWQPTLDRLRASGKTVLMGTRLPAPTGLHAIGVSYDFSAELAALHGEAPPSFPTANSKLETKAEPMFAYDNALIIRGAETGTFKQRIPVPVAMWNPLKTTGAHLNLNRAGVINVHGQTAAVLICYEQLLTWPVLVSLAQHPTVLIAVANDYWATGTPIKDFQFSAVRAWARLFGLPFLSAVNT